MIERKYKIIKCPNCYLLQVTGASKSLKCLRCNKSRVISNLKVFFKSYSAKECQLVLGDIKKREFEECEGNHDDFFSYLNKSDDLKKF